MVFRRVIWVVIFVALAGSVCADEAVIDTVAGTGEKADIGDHDALSTNIGQPFGVEVGPDGALFVTEVENHRIRRVDLATGKVTTVAGTGRKGYTGDGGPATAAKLNEPYEVRFDSKGNLYFVEMQNHVVRRVDAKTGVISTVAGTGKPGYAGDGEGAGALQRVEFRQPHSIALHEDRWLFVADIGNHRIRRIDLTSGVIESVAGNGEKKLPGDGIAKDRPMLGPRALCIAGDVMFVALREGHSVWALNLKTNRLSHVAGSGKQGFQDGGPREAAFNGPKGIAAGKDGALFVVDTENQVIRRIDTKTRDVTTIAGMGPNSRGFGGDAVRNAAGDPLRAKFDRPHGIAVGPDGAIFIGDTNNHRVRRVR